MGLWKSFFTVSSFTFLSRILGFCRDVLLAAILGATAPAQAFLIAFKLPNFFRKLFAEGAFNAAFVPTFSSIYVTDGKEDAILFAEKVFSVLFITLIIFTIIMEMAMPLVVYGLAPGFAKNTYKFELCIELSKITFPYLMFISLVSLFAGMLNSVGKFAAVASTPIILNCCLIGAILFFSDSNEASSYALSYGVSIAGILQFIWLLVACRLSGISLTLRLPTLTPDVKKFLQRLGPGIIGAGVVQLNVWVDAAIGTFIPGAVAYLYYADRINQLPLAIIGTAMGAALLPLLSRQIRENKMEEAIATENRALETVLFFAIPATAALIILSDTIIMTLFERGAFGKEETLATSASLIAYATGLPAFIMMKIFTAAFFADGDTKTPVKIASISLVVNVILNLTFIWLFRRIGLMPHAGLALATSCAAWLNIIFLVRILQKQDKFTFNKAFRAKMLCIIVATFVMAVVLLIGQELLHGWIEEGEKIKTLAVLVIAGAGAFFSTAYFNKN